MINTVDVRYWFSIQVVFACPFCKKANKKMMYSESLIQDQNKIAALVTAQLVRCALCKRKPTDGTHLGVIVVPTTLDQAKASGFEPPIRSDA
jgi:hypothetical protein